MDNFSSQAVIASAQSFEIFDPILNWALHSIGWCAKDYKLTPEEIVEIFRAGLASDQVRHITGPHLTRWATSDAARAK